MRMNLSLTASFVAATGMLCGCVDIGSPLIILQAQVPDIDKGACVVPVAKSALRRTEGVLDVALDRPREYVLFPLLSNRLPVAKGLDGIEPNRITIEGFEVTIEAPPGIVVPWPPGCLPEFRWDVPQMLNPLEEAGMSVQVMRACDVTTIRTMFMSGKLPTSFGEQVRFRAKVRARARHGGSALLSDPFIFPIRVCYGCLQTGYLGPFAGFNFPKVPPCDKLAENPYAGNPCNIAQDSGPVLCCALDAQGVSLECPGQPRAVKPPPAP